MTCPGPGNTEAARGVSTVLRYTRALYCAILRSCSAAATCSTRLALRALSALLARAAARCAVHSATRSGQLPTVLWRFAHTAPLSFRCGMQIQHETSGDPARLKSKCEFLHVWDRFVLAKILTHRATVIQVLHIKRNIQVAETLINMKESVCTFLVGHCWRRSTRTAPQSFRCCL